MLTRIALLAAALAALPAAAARPLVPLYDAAGITKACDAGLEGAKKTIAKMQAVRGAGAIFTEWNRLQIEIEDTVNPIYLLGSVHPDKSVRDAAEPCLTKYTTLGTDIFQDEKLFARVKAAKPAGAHQVRLQKDLLEAFEDSGVALPPDKRKRAKEIVDKLEELRQAFDRNVRDDPSTITFTPAQMAGMSADYLAARKKDAAGNYILDLKSPTYTPFMTNAKDGQAREAYYKVKFREGGPPNLKLLEEMFVLRQELAGLYGLPTFAHYGVRRKMAATPEAIDKFLTGVKAAVVEIEKREVEELRTEKARDLGTPLADTQIRRWDVSYYQELVRKARYSVDQEELRKYFPTDKAIEYALLVTQKLYGVKITEVKVPVWQPDVRYFDVADAKTGQFLSGFYLDLYPREGKYGHAAAFPVRGASRLAGRTPVSVLVVNFNRKGLDGDEMETLMHEFGHVLHGVLSRTDYVSHAGTSVQNDFVEAPSQMFEEWVRREEPLALMKTVCPQCPQLTRQQLANIDAARKYGRGTRYARQWVYAAYDMELSRKPQDPLALWKAMELDTPLGHVEGTMLPAAFGHIASNYAAGYYGYMWSEVLALDMLSGFKGKLMDPAVGKRYRDIILAQGGQEEAMSLVRRFLGREPSTEAFFAEITGKR